MPNRPEYPTATVFERAAYAVLAATMGIGLLVAVVAAFQSQLPQPDSGQSIAAAAMCVRPATFSAACPTPMGPTLVASR